MDFYLKVILPSLPYGILDWGSCGKTSLSYLESRLERKSWTRLDGHH